MRNYNLTNIKELAEKSLLKPIFNDQMGFFSLTKDSEYNISGKQLYIDAYCIVLVKKGNFEIEFNYQNISAHEYDLLLFTPFSNIRIAPESEIATADGIFIERDLFDRTPNSSHIYGPLSRIRSTSSIPRVTLTANSCQELQKTFSLFCSYLGMNHKFQKGLNVGLLNFLLLQIAEELYQGSMTIKDNNKHKDEMFNRFIQLMRIHYKQFHNISFYADKMNVSTTYLSRIVRETTQKTVYYYITERLYTEACHLLACTDYTVWEISCILNFSDQSAFGKFFKSKSGLSPQHYRQQIWKKAD